MKKLLRISLLISIFFVSCKKEMYETKVSNEVKNKIENKSFVNNTLTKLDYFKLLAQEFLTSAKNSQEFKKWLYESCYAQDSGDYYISVYDLLSKNEDLGYYYWDRNKASYIREEIIDKIKEIDVLNNDCYTAPIVFIPFLEDINLDSLTKNIPLANPKACIGMEYDTTTTYCPGYDLDWKDSLNSISTIIDEEYAWTHEVWVFSQEEAGVESGTVSLTSVLNTSTSRIDGGAEYGGIVKVNSLGQLESWIAGKLEFTFYVYNPSGTQISYIKFPGVKRKNFKNQAWYDYNSFLFYWNRATIGDWQIEGWIERDGGNSSPISVSIPPPTGYPGPNVSITIPSENLDDDCGRKIVQFSDPISTVYPISYMNFKRKN